MRPLKEVIDEAAKLCGGQNALADRLGISKGYMSKIASGKQQISPEKAALLAEVVPEEDARDLAAQAMIEQAKGEEAERLKRVFFTVQGLGAVAIVLFSALALLGGNALASEKPSVSLVASRQGTHSRTLNKTPVRRLGWSARLRMVAGRRSRLESDEHVG